MIEHIFDATKKITAGRVGESPEPSEDEETSPNAFFASPFSISDKVPQSAWREQKKHKFSVGSCLVIAVLYDDNVVLRRAD
jgi:hypothetical protein